MFLMGKLRRCWLSFRLSRAGVLKVVVILVVLTIIQYPLYQTWKHRRALNSPSEMREPSGKSITDYASSLHETAKPVIASNVTSKPLEDNVTSRTGFSAKKLFYEGRWNSSFVSVYHKHYSSVNCPAIIRGERLSIIQASQLLKRSRKQTPIDSVVKNWTSDCERYRNVRGYPTAPRSKEETEFPIAYIITTHTGSAQLERLLRVVYQPQNVYCIHPDAKSSSSFHAAVRSLANCLPNVFITSELVKVNYAHSSRLQADINCLSDLLVRPEPWKYVLNLCAQDFPLKTNLEIVRQLKAFRGHNDIPGIVAPSWFDHRTRVHHEFRNNMMIKMPDVHKPPPPQNFKFFFGNAYYAATRQFADFVIHNQTAIDLLKYSEDTYSPDEHYWVTLQRIPGVPGGYTTPSWNSTVRFVHWQNTFKTPECVGRYVRNICVFGAGYLQHLAIAPHLFANKFHMSFDPIAIQCMEQLLDYRSKHPEAIKDFIPGFPATNMFGME